MSSVWESNGDMSPFRRAISAIRAAFRFGRVRGGAGAWGLLLEELSWAVISGIGNVDL